MTLCLVRVTSWIVLLVEQTRTTHEVTRTKHEPKYFRLQLDVTFEAKPTVSEDLRTR